MSATRHLHPLKRHVANLEKDSRQMEEDSRQGRQRAWRQEGTHQEDRDLIEMSESEKNDEIVGQE
jgi:hypothetical protein